MKRLRAAAIFVLAGLALTPAGASNIYTVAYEGDTMPEQGGTWARHYYVGATRTIETDGQGNNYLKLDSYNGWYIYDYYVHTRQISPSEPDERFFAEWRVLISAAHAYADHGLGVAADDGHTINYKYRVDAIWDAFDGWTAPIEPGVFHTYRIESANLVSYQLFVDGTLVRNALSFDGLGGGFAAFGDSASGGQSGSTSVWDYVRFGVYEVPEPVSALLLAVVAVCACDRRRRGR
jgi:hypothetical protein